MMMNSNEISVILIVLALSGMVPEADTVKKPVPWRRPAIFKEN
jgi:hypothetical protein